MTATADDRAAFEAWHLEPWDVPLPATGNNVTEALWRTWTAAIAHERARVADQASQGGGGA